MCVVVVCLIIISIRRLLMMMTVRFFFVLLGLCLRFVSSMFVAVVLLLWVAFCRHMSLLMRMCAVCVRASACMCACIGAHVRLWF